MSDNRLVASATETITDSLASLDQPSIERLHTRLVFLADAEAPWTPSSSHTLDELDEVRFRNGTRAVERRGSRLVLAFADPRISRSHGRLTRTDAGWLLQDEESTNGCVVDGVKTRQTLLADGALLQLGRSMFRFCRSKVAAVPTHLAADVDVDGLPAWPLGMATFAPGLAQAFEALIRLAGTPTSLLLVGETGTGKELIARAMHEASRRSGNLVAVNCGALSPMLLGSELFGHRRGAFTSAEQDRRGMVRSADQGTLFLDEIGELPLEMQAALLRVLQEREVTPLGSDRPIAVEFRLITATLRDLLGATQDGRFRADLYARIAGHVTVLPPLRERREDLGLLVRHMLKQHAPDRAVRFAPAVWRALVRHEWLHNIRELDSAISTALRLATGERIELMHLPAALQRLATGDGTGAGAAATTGAPARANGHDRALNEADIATRALLIEQLIAHEGKVAAVAAALGKQRAQIYKWVERFGIDLAAFRRR